MPRARYGSTVVPRAWEQDSLMYAAQRLFLSDEIRDDDLGSPG